MTLNRIIVGDCRDGMRELIAAGVKVQCIVTSPPFWNMRDYEVAGQIGLESSLQEWVDTMVEVFALARELLRDDGVLWLELGDAYASQGGPGWQGKNGQRADRRFTQTRDSVAMREIGRRPPDGLKPKDLMGQPWRVAFALQESGWYLRSEIIWHRPNPMPESVVDRPTKAHSTIFLLTKSPRYYYDASAIAEPVTGNAHARGDGVNPKARNSKVAGWAEGPGSHATLAHAKSKKDSGRAAQGLRDSTKFGRGAGWRNKQNESFSGAVSQLVETRNVRTVWTIPPEPFSGAHFATFPRDLVRRCVLASTKPGDVVFDPFLGSGTVAQVADELGRQWIGCELNREYAAMYGTARGAQHGMPL